MNIFRAINNLVFPPRCIFCDRVLDFRTKLNVCTKCTDAVRIPCGIRCSVCFSETRGYFGTDLCENYKGGELGSKMRESGYNDVWATMQQNIEGCATGMAGFPSPATVNTVYPFNPENQKFSDGNLGWKSN